MVYFSFRTFISASLWSGSSILFFSALYCLRRAFWDFFIGAGVLCGLEEEGLERETVWFVLEAEVIKMLLVDSIRREKDDKDGVERYKFWILVSSGVISSWYFLIPSSDHRTLCLLFGTIGAIILSSWLDSSSLTKGSSKEEIIRSWWESIRGFSS